MRQPTPPAPPMVAGMVRRLRAHLRALAAGLSGPAVLAVIVCWVLLGWRLSADWALPAYGYLAAVGVALARVDLRERRLPDALTLPAYPTILVLLTAAAVLGSGSGTLPGALLGGAAMGAVYLALRLIWPAGMGLGDVKLSGVLGMATGWFGWNTWTLAVLAAFGLGATAGLLLLAAGRAHRRTVLSFGPAMLTGALLAVVLA